jgi:PAS domain S-box-containing protein
MISHADLLFALDSTDNGVVMTDTKGNITYANKAFIDLYGFEKSEPLGKNMSLLKSGLHNSEFYKDLWDTIQNGESWEGEICNKTLDGKLIWEQTRISPIRNNGRTNGYIAVKENRTYKRELEAQIVQEQFLLNELFSNSPFGITICQPIMASGTVTDAMIVKSNPVASSILNRLGLVGLSFRKLFSSLDYGSDRLQRMSTEKLEFETFLPDVNKYLSFKTFPLQENRFCVIYIDVTNYKQTIKALVESEQRYSSLVEDSPAMICRFNLKGRLIYTNSLFGDTYNMKPIEAMGKEFYSFFPDDVRASIVQEVSTLSLQNQQISIEKRVRVGKNTKWQKWIIRALLDKQGKLFEYQALGIDFTEIKDAESALIENRNKLNTVVSNNIIGVGLVSANGCYSMVNTRMCELMGLTEKELLSMSPNDITHPDDLELSQIMLDRLFKKEIPQYNIEKRFLRKNGTSFWANLYVSPVKDKDGNISEVVGLIADIDEKKKIEMQIVENERKLKELNNTKDKLFSIIAHDIKNPFHAILGLSTLLHEQIDDLTQDEIHTFASKILEAGENTYKLLDDLLTWGRSQLGKLKVVHQDVAPSAIVDEVFHTYRSMATGKNIAMANQIPADTFVWADYDMVKFMLRNLIHNGLKFTPEGGMVHCTAINNIETKTVKIEVRDTGIGICKEKIKILFDINAFLTTVGTAEEKGTGLGLSLTHEMIGLNNGTISVESEEGKGTTFSILLPMGGLDT